VPTGKGAAGGGATQKPGAAKPASKIKKATQQQNQKVAGLLALAATAPGLQFHQRHSLAKLFELQALSVLLQHFRLMGGKAKLVNPGASPPGPGIASRPVARFPGGPASRDRNKFSFVELYDRSNRLVAEAWVSVQFQTFSYWRDSKGGTASPKRGLAALHELDIMLCNPLSPKVRYPPHTALQAGFSCKHVALLTKQNVREALGFRREMGAVGLASPSLVPWLVSTVPARPAAPLYLLSSSPAVTAYQDHIGQLGVYCAHLPFP